MDGTPPEVKPSFAFLAAALAKPRLQCNGHRDCTSVGVHTSAVYVTGCMHPVTEWTAKVGTEEQTSTVQTHC